MKVLKFTLDGGGELPEIEYLEETIGLGDVKSIESILLAIDDSLGLGDKYSAIEEVSFDETIGLNDSHIIIIPIEITETLGLGDEYRQPDYVNIFETLGLGDDISNTMDIYVEIDETIGLGDGGYGYLEINYNLRWRTRTKKLNYGFGASLHGDVVEYGEGDVIDELKEFKVKVIRLSDTTTLRTDTITIVNKSYPDGSAQYVYTGAMNVIDNGYFEPNLRFEVYQVDINDVWSPAKYIDITVTDEGGDLI
jgi:hypothetical protein